MRALLAKEGAMKLSRSMVMGAAFLAWAGAANAQQPNFDAIPIKVVDLAPGAFMLEGAGGNVTVVAGKGGVIMVDGQFAPMHDKIAAAVKAVTDAPIKYLINTHYHGDHVGGNAPFARDGVTTIAHENVGKRLASGTVNSFTGAKAAPVEKDAIPKRPYTKSFSVSVGGRSARIGHPVAAHTDGDSFVYFPEVNVLSTGDILTLGRYPLVDFGNGGSINGLISAVEGYVKIANDQTKVVPGHGPVVDRAALVKYRDMLVTARDRVAKLIAEGKSDKEAVAARPFPDLDKQTGANQAQSDVFVRGIYNSLQRK
jgi:cyclase